MASSDIQRKLTAILCADVAGYSRAMGADEEATIDFLRSKGCRMQRMQWWNWTSFVS